MTDTTFQTEETASLVPITDDAAPAEETVGDRILALETELEAHNLEYADLSAAYDQEILDHAETTKKLNKAERFLVQMFDIWASDLELGIDGIESLSSNDAEKELQAAIVAAQTRIAAGEALKAGREARKAMLEATGGASKTGDDVLTA
jgi:predicted nuclease with TOPRIM domain